RFTAGNFAHAAINNSDRPFHNITIELLKPSTNVKTCTGSCDSGGCIGSVPRTPGDNSPLPGCSGTIRRISADQWTASMASLPPNSTLDRPPTGPTLLIAVTNLELARQSGDEMGPFNRAPGGFDWIAGGRQETMHNGTSQPAKFVTLEFKPEQKK
ncbi:MAG: hypothetical protein WA672_11825, partial [Candidatus Angelobacter sp.]